MIATELLWVNVVLSSFILPLLILGVRGIFNIRRDLYKMDGRVGSIETKILNHEKLDDGRFDTTKRDIDRIDKLLNRDRK